MTEGRNPTLGCAFGCVGARCGWVPFPPTPSRRHPLIDAVGRTDNPCDRPARCPPSYNPTPKFRGSPKEMPACNIDCYRQEQVEAKIKDYCEQRQKYLDHYCPCPPPEMVIESLDPINNPIAVQMPSDPPPEKVWFLRDSKRCKSDILAGLFNPNDNVPRELLNRARCDPYYQACGPCLPQYPCRGVIQYPQQEWVSLAQEKRLCLPEDCKGSKYLNPDYMAEQQEIRDKIKLKNEMEKQKRWEALISTSGYKKPHPCCPERLSQTPYCTCNDCFC